MYRDRAYDLSGRRVAVRRVRSSVNGVNTLRWPRYLDAFHTQHPGITEDVLGHARTADGDAYDWLADAVPAQSTVLDLGCGTAPLWRRLPGRIYLGMDLNAAELAAARHSGALHLIRATATAIPVRTDSIDTVVCSMALQILTPLPRVLAEVSRVLREDGRLVATVPVRGPLRVTDFPVLAGLLTTLGRGLTYPNDRMLHRFPVALRAANLTLIADESRLFTYRLRTDCDAERFLTSLYLPGLPQWRRRAARAYLRVLTHARISVPIPIRRVIVQQAASPRFGQPD